MIASKTLALIALVAIGGVASAQQVTLRYKPPVGKSYAYTMTMDTATVAPGAGGNQSVKQTATNTIKVLSRSGEQTKVSTTTSNVKVTVPPNSPLKSQVAQMEKQGAMTATMTISSLGLVTNVSSGKTPNMQAANDMLSTIGPFSAMPKAAVGVGSTWTSSFNLGQMIAKTMPMMKVSGGNIPLKLKLTRFVSQGGKRLAEVKMTGAGTAKLSMAAQPGTRAPSRSQGFAMNVAINISSTSLIDVATGVPVTTSTAMTNKMSVGNQGSMSQTMKMSMKLK